MTVRELIQRLLDCPLDHRVVVVESHGYQTLADVVDVFSNIPSDERDSDLRVVALLY